MLVKVTDVAQQLLAPLLGPGAQALDATVGQGHDTLWLAQKVGPSGKVWGIDRQGEAIRQTKERLEAHGCASWVELWEMEHRNLAQMQLGPALGTLDAAIVNLGYLPGGDSDVFTEPAQSEILLRWLLQRMRPGGRFVCCVYPGHEQGRGESQWAMRMAQELPWTWGHSWVHQVANRSERCPWIWAVDRGAKLGRSLDWPSRPSDP